MLLWAGGRLLIKEGTFEAGRTITDSFREIFVTGA